MKRQLSTLFTAVFLLGFAAQPLFIHAQEAPAPAEELPVAGDEERVSISFTEASIQDVLRSLASMRDGVNIVIDPDVTGQVSLQLEDVSWDTALKLVTDIHNLKVTKDGNIYRVGRPATAVSSDLTIELHTAETIAMLSDEEALKMAGDPSLTPEEALAFLSENPGDYVSRIVADQQPAVDIVNALARAAALNFAFSSEFDQPASPDGTAKAQPPVMLQPISLNLKNIKLEDALQLIAEQGKLSCVNRNGVWLVSPFRTETAQLEPLKLETFTINYLPLDDELVKILQGLCTPREKVTRGKNKILIVLATADTISSIRDTLLVMDRPTPQVLIEARFFKVTESFAKKLGINWQDLGSTDGFKATTKFGSVDDIFAPNLASTSSTANPANQFMMDLSDVRLDSFRYAYVGLEDIAFVAHAAENDNDVTQLANPKLLVNSDEQAFIHIGEQRPIIKQTVDATGLTPFTAIELDEDYGNQEITEINLGGTDQNIPQRTYTTNKGYLDLGTKLTVLPSVKTEEEVYLKVAPEMIDVIGNTDGTEDTYPTLFRTYVRSQFTIKSGQTIAIGGLVREEDKLLTNGVPLLNKIPWIGSRLFSYENTEKQRTETIIFLTVKVISGKELTTTSGLPINTKLIQDKLNTIHLQDANGAEYDEMKAQEALEAKEAAEAEAAKNRNPFKRLFGMDKEEETEAPLEEPESYLEEEVEVVE